MSPDFALSPDDVIKRQKDPDWLYYASHTLFADGIPNPDQVAGRFASAEAYHAFLSPADEPEEPPEEEPPEPPEESPEAAAAAAAIAAPDKGVDAKGPEGPEVAKGPEPVAPEPEPETEPGWDEMIGALGLHLDDLPDEDIDPTVPAVKPTTKAPAPVAAPPSRVVVPQTHHTTPVVPAAPHESAIAAHDDGPTAPMHTMHLPAYMMHAHADLHLSKEPALHIPMDTLHAEISQGETKTV